MSGRVIKFEGSTHTEADRLLPWYANGTLQAEERLQVERHLVECAHCQQELAWLRSIREAFAAQAEQDDVSANVQHLHRRTRIRRGKSPSSSIWQRRERRLAWLAVLQSAVILALAVVLLHRQHGPYRTLSAPPDKGSLLVVAFDAQTREAQMRELVRASGARIVGGPTEEGAYVLRVPDAQEATARRKLDGSPRIKWVEDLSSGGNP